MSMDYYKFPCHPVAAEEFEIIGMNTIILNYHYRLDPNLSKGVCKNFWVPCACPAYVTQLDKYLFNKL